jgi:hypothetical protein
MNDFYKGVSTMTSLFLHKKMLFIGSAWGPQRSTVGVFWNNSLNQLWSSGKHLVFSEKSFERNMIDQLHMGIGWSS